MKRPFSIGDVLCSVRDMEQSEKAIVLGYAENDFVLVQFAGELPRALPVASLQRAGDRKAEPRFASKNLADAATLGDYIIRVESGISQREKEKNEKSIH